MAPDSSSDETSDEYVHGVSCEGRADCASVLQVHVLEVPGDLDVQLRGQVLEVILALC